MAIAATYNKKQEDLNKQQGAIKSANPYRGMNGVSTNTANNLGNYQAGYKPSAQAQAAQDNLAAVQAQKPQNYTSKYGQQLDNILQQIQNPEKFNYEFNGDNLFKYYADLYTQKGKQASMDAMGQAAALTGGYGNSYGQQVGQQQYQQYLLNLYDRGMDLRDRAYQQYQDQLGNQKDAYSMLSNAEERAYGMYRDQYGDWQNERDYAAGRADIERDYDYGQYKDNLDYWTGLAQIENQAYNTEADRQEAIRQYDQDFAEKQRQSALDEAYRQAGLAEEKRKTDLDEAYRRDNLSWQQSTDARDYAEQVRQYEADLAEKQRQANLDEAYRRDNLNWQQSTDARDYAEQIRQFEAEMAEKQRQANMDELYRQAQLAEQIRGTDLDEAYRQSQLAEQIRGTNLDEAYRRDTFGWQQYTDARDYAEQIRQYESDLAEKQRQFNEQMAQSKEEFERTDKLNWEKLEQDQAQFDAQLTENQRQYNRSMAAEYASAILANGQIPSNALLVAAGLSLDDAKKLIKQVTGGGGSGKGNGNDKGDFDIVPTLVAGAKTGIGTAIDNTPQAKAISAVTGQTYSTQKTPTSSGVAANAAASAGVDAVTNLYIQALQAANFGNNQVSLTGTSSKTTNTGLQKKTETNKKTK